MTIQNVLATKSKVVRSLANEGLMAEGGPFSDPSLWTLFYLRFNGYLSRPNVVPGEVSTHIIQKATILLFHSLYVDISSVSLASYVYRSPKDTLCLLDPRKALHSLPDGAILEVLLPGQEVDAAEINSISLLAQKTPEGDFASLWRVLRRSALDPSIAIFERGWRVLTSDPALKPICESIDLPADPASLVWPDPRFTILRQAIFGRGLGFRWENVLIAQLIASVRSGWKETTLLFVQGTFFGTRSFVSNPI